MYFRVVAGRPNEPTAIVTLVDHTTSWKYPSLTRPTASWPTIRATATDVKNVTTRLKTNSMPYQNELRAMVWVLVAEPEGPVFLVSMGYSRDKVTRTRCP